MEQCIPKWVLPPGKNLPWMNKKLRQAMRRRNALYKYRKRTGNYSKFKFARSEFVAQMRKAKKDYLARLNPRNPKTFLNTWTKLPVQYLLYPVMVLRLATIKIKPTYSTPSSPLVQHCLPSFVLFWFKPCWGWWAPSRTFVCRWRGGAVPSNSGQIQSYWLRWIFSHNAEVHCHQHCPICYTVI